MKKNKKQTNKQAPPTRVNPVFCDVQPVGRSSSGHILGTRDQHVPKIQSLVFKPWSYKQYLRPWLEEWRREWFIFLKKTQKKHTNKKGSSLWAQSQVWRWRQVDTFISAAALSRRHMVGGVCTPRNRWGTVTTCYSRCPVNISASCRDRRGVFGTGEVRGVVRVWGSGERGGGRGRAGAGKRVSSVHVAEVADRLVPHHAQVVHGAAEGDLDGLADAGRASLHHFDLVYGLVHPQGNHLGSR